jgi:hypothetical protein
MYLFSYIYGLLRYRYTIGKTPTMVEAIETSYDEWEASHYTFG